MNAPQACAALPVLALIDAFRRGEPVLLLDDDGPESEGRLIQAACAVDERSVTLMASEARGLVCLALGDEQRRRLKLPLLGEPTRHGERFAVSIEAAEGVTTGISAADRALTMRLAADPTTLPEQLVQPGHVFPLIAHPDGVLSVAGFAEGACDLARLAGLAPAAALVAVLDEAGDVARGAELTRFATRFGFARGTLAELIHYRLLTGGTLCRELEREVPTRHGRFQLIAYRDAAADALHLALVLGKPTPATPTLVRVQAAEKLRDVLQLSDDGASGWNADRALAAIAAAGAGVLVLLDRHEAPGDVHDEIERVSSGEPAHAPRFAHRMVGVGARILRDLNVGRMRLMSQPLAYRVIAGFDLDVSEFVPYQPGNNPAR
ncbi:3,4-dihydroxy-2-butanone-4-phosphate synthase [Crenobacter sp. SG2303]|uniref:3,4-dihydroxy-2-butanone 4-phosphate synthase n=1 Tax=Crenobacter oryzisoli TaxID=3056844 RepID=A0ABT7XL36_9NEIS|nr:3,4-dihydroxy-2-butanone-4-phosphate synthase [Crenobacter sp. SG2303]MDN0074509.1 3,4-dihydroxy-2-butanone-4-phosphate synthase [Crenobacter sp. SG2303]